MPTTTKELKEVAELLAHEDDTAYYYGAYDGRWYHKGFAVVFDPNYTKTFCDLLNEKTESNYPSQAKRQHGIRGRLVLGHQPLHGCRQSRTGEVC